jgi:hypothetical protein
MSQPFVQGRHELWVEVALSNRDVTPPDIERDVVAITDDVDAGACHLFAQLGFLLVHVIADSTACQRTAAAPITRI